MSEYPTDATRPSLGEALQYGMTDLDRLDRMVLRRIGREFFVLSRRDDKPNEPENGQ